MNDLTLIELTIENIKNIAAMNLKPNGEPLILTGDNEAGKSAVLEALWGAITGKKFSEPVKRGEKKGKVVADLGEFIVTKKYTAGGENTTLKVETKDGMSPAGGAQGYLNKLIGSIAFDPEAFSKMKPTEQIKILRELTGLDTSKIDAEYKEVFDERTYENRQLRDQEGILEGYDTPDPELPSELVNASDIVKKRDECAADMDAIEYKGADVKKAETLAFRCAEFVKEAKKKYELANNELKKAQKLHKDVSAEYDALMADPIDYDVTLEEYRRELEAVDDKNNEIIANNLLKGKIQTTTGTIRVLKTQAANKTAKLDGLQEQRSKLIAAADMPIEGLTFSNDEVRYNGTLMSRLSSGQRIRVSMAIAIALNPALKVVYIQDGSLLDKVGMDTVLEMCAEHGFQPIIERVGGPSAGSIHIVDGSVVEATEGE